MFLPSKNEVDVAEPTALVRRKFSMTTLIRPSRLNIT